MEDPKRSSDSEADAVRKALSRLASSTSQTTGRGSQQEAALSGDERRMRLMEECRRQVATAIREKERAAALQRISRLAFWILAVSTVITIVYVLTKLFR